MRMTDTLVIGEFGPFLIEAEYDYRIQISYQNKHAPLDPSDIQVDEIKLHIKRPHFKWDKEAGLAEKKWRTINTASLLEIPGWLWKLLTDPEVLAELDTEPPSPEYEYEERYDKDFDI